MKVVVKLQLYFTCCAQIFPKFFDRNQENFCESKCALENHAIYCERFLFKSFIVTLNGTIKLYNYVHVLNNFLYNVKNE